MSRTFADLPWRGIVTDINSRTLSILDRRTTNREVTHTLGVPASSTGQVAADDPEINIPYPDPTSPSLLTNNRRLHYMFRREERLTPLTPPYVCRFGGIVMSLEDEAGDAATSRYVAYDPWQLLMSRPVRNPANGALPGEDGLTFQATDGWLFSEIAVALLEISLTFEGEHHIETYGTSYPLVTPTDVIPDDVIFSQGLTVGEAWQQLVESGYIEIKLPPLYEPIDSPGKVCQLEIAPKVGELRADVVMGWDKAGNSVTDISRMVDGTRLANRVAYFSGQVAAPIQSDAASRAAYGDFWALQFFPDGSNITLVAAQALAQLVLRRNGVKTLSFGPAPERSDLALRDYDIGDQVAVWASRNLREPIGVDYDTFNPNHPEACGFQRVYSIPITIDDNGVASVSGIATADEREGGII